MTPITSLHPAPSTEAMPPLTPTLATLLDQDLAWLPSVQSIYSSHLAMALMALHRMGADDGRLQQELDRTAPHLEPQDRPDLLAERVREVEADGIDAVLARRAPALLVGPATALFHPVIRLSYALELGHTGQVAAALLDWERRLDPEAPDAVEALGEVDLDHVTDAALAAHLAIDDFFTLHLVTGARAVRVVGDRLGQPHAATLARHALAGHHRFVPASVGAIAPDLDLSALPDRAEVAARGIASRDAHVIKLTDVALAEEARTGDLRYRHVAAHIVGLR